MPHSSLLKPYVPKKLPIPLVLNQELKDALLRTHKAMTRYNTSLQQVRHPAAHARRLLLKEAAASTSLSSVRTLAPQKKLQMRALIDAFESAEQALKQGSFSKTVLCAIHARIKQPTATSQSQLGRYRTTQNWIGPQRCTQDEAYYLPPSPTQVNSSMKQWVTYCNQQTHEPLLQLSLLVAQFLIIHPFMDGNGRVARLLVPLFLYRKGLVDAPCLFLSPYIQQHRLAYLKALYAITAEGNWHNWILFFLKGLRAIALKKH